MNDHALRLLVIDDSRDDFDLLIRALERAGFAVDAIRAQTEAEMLTALDGARWDMVIVDWILPQFSAPDALRILRERAGGVPCVVLSGASGEELAVLAMRLGASDFIRKDQLELLPTTIARELHFARGGDS